MQSLVLLSKSVLSILWNIALEEKCHNTLIENNIPELIVPFCFNSSIQIRFETKSFLGLLHQLTGPLYYPFLELSLEEKKIARVCFLNAAVSDDHNVILKLGNSSVRYSAFELAVAIAGLIQHKANLVAFTDIEILAASFKLLVTGSQEEKVVSIRLISKLVNEPNISFVVLEHHPDILEVLQVLSESDEIKECLKLDASMLLKNLLDRVSGISEDVQERKSYTMKEHDLGLERKKELERLLTWATKEMNNSKVLHNAADNDTVEAVMSMMFLTSHVCVNLHHEESRLFIDSALRGCPGFLSILQDYIQRHFLSMYFDYFSSLVFMSKICVSCVRFVDAHSYDIHIYIYACLFWFTEMIKEPDGPPPLHPVSLALNCALALSNCNSQFRCSLGTIGFL